MCHTAGIHSLAGDATQPSRRHLHQFPCRRLHQFSSSPPASIFHVISLVLITKIDLLRRDTDLNCIADWVIESVVKKKLNVLTVHLTSSKTLVGIIRVIAEI